MKTNKTPYKKAALNFNISNINTIWRWKHIWETEGAETLYRSKGQQAIMSANGNAKKKQTT